MPNKWFHWKTKLRTRYFSSYFFMILKSCKSDLCLLGSSGPHHILCRVAPAVICGPRQVHVIVYFLTGGSPLGTLRLGLQVPHGLCSCCSEPGEIPGASISLKQVLLQGQRKCYFLTSITMNDCKMNIKQHCFCKQESSPISSLPCITEQNSPIIFRINKYPICEHGRTCPYGPLEEQIRPKTCS